MYSECCASAEETFAYGERLAATVQVGAVLALVGTLGAGKTQLTKGLVAGLGCTAEVSSPTFALVQEYAGGRLSVAHFDLYRLQSAGELWNIGWDDYLDGDGVCIVEWADLFPAALPPGTRWFQLTHQPEGRHIQEFDYAP